MLAQAQVVILTEEGNDEELQELSGEPEQEEEADLPNV
jgi:hypothetical protein